MKNFMGPGISKAQADAEALEAAKAFRAELAEKGILSEPKQKDPNYTSEVPGVRWDKRRQNWRVDISRRGSQQKISGGRFTEKAAAEAKALDLLIVVPASVPPQGPGVNWSQGEQQWHAKCDVGGSTSQGEAQGPLGGGAGARVPSRCGMEEEAGEGEGCKAQGKAWEEAAKLDPECTARVARMAHLQHPNLQT